MAEAAFLLFEPKSDVLGAFGGRTVVHRAQDVLNNAHEFASRHRVAMGGRIAPSRVMVELTLDVGQKPARADAEEIRLHPRHAELLLHEDEPSKRVFGGAQAPRRLE